VILELQCARDDYDDVMMMMIIMTMMITMTMTPPAGSEAIKEEQADVMRYEAIGSSADGTAFYFFLDPDVDPLQSLWIFSDSSAQTLAQHVNKHDKPLPPPPSPKPPPKAAKGKKSPAKKAPAAKERIVPCHVQSEYAGCWRVEARGLEECKALAVGFGGSKQECERALAEVLEVQVIKAVERRVAEAELAKKREARLQVCVCVFVCLFVCLFACACARVRVRTRTFQLVSAPFVSRQSLRENLLCPPLHLPCPSAREGR